jgi:protein-disulfide isomerase
MTEAEKETSLTEESQEPITTVESPEPDNSPGRSGFLSSPWYFLVIGLLVGGLAGFYLYPVVSSAPDPVEAAPPMAEAESSAEINEGDPHQQVMLAVIANARHFYGDPNAPVTLVEFGDFNCGYCGKWTNETLPLIDEKYIQEGKVRMAYVHYPILGPDSMTAAEAAECVAIIDEGSFWEYHDLLYNNQGIGFTLENLTALADELGVDTAEFEACMNDFPDRASLEDDIRLSQVMGVRGTPAFLVNGIALAGAYPYENFEELIDGILAGNY